MNIREQRLASEYRRMQQLVEQSSMITFAGNGEPPDEYIVTFSCLGLSDPNTSSNKHLVHMYLDAEFPRRPPVVSFLSQIFHPNVMSPIQSPRIQQWLREMLAVTANDPAAQDTLNKLIENPELRKGHVCLDTLNLNWSPFITLDLVCLELGEMIQYKRYNLGDPLNRTAAAWAEHNRHLLPWDGRALCDIKALGSIRILSSDDDLDVAIQFL
jgi:ubiquitin-protein ligase